MGSFTDYLGLNKHKLFKNLRETLPSDIIKTQNVLTVNDGVLYMWDFQDNCVLTLNVKESRCREDGGVPHQAQSAAKLVIERYELCKNAPDEEIKLFLTPQDFNHGMQVVDLNFTFPFAAGDNLVMKVILHSEVVVPVHEWVPLFNFEDKQGFCRALDSYFEELAYDMERSIGLTPKTCPIPKGVYHANQLTLDFKKMRLQTFPFGKLRARIEGHSKDSKKLVMCSLYYLNNFP